MAVKVTLNVEYTKGCDDRYACAIVNVFRSASDGIYPFKGADMKASVLYTMEHFDKYMEPLWRMDYHGLVPTAGLNKLIDACFKTGLASPAWYVGIIDGASTPVVSATDTMASHAGWVEYEDISNSTRPAFTAGTVAAGAVDNSAARALFTISADGLVWGSFMVDEDTIGGNTQTLFDAGVFAEGAQAVKKDGILRITLRPTISADTAV